MPYLATNYQDSGNFDDIAVHAAVLRRVRKSQTRKTSQVDNEEAIDMLLEPVSIEYFQEEIQEILERDRFSEPLGVVKGFMWALLISIHMWLILGIILALLFK